MMYSERNKILSALILLVCIACTSKSGGDNDSIWKIKSQEEMIENILSSEDMEINEGLLFPKNESGKITTKIKHFTEKRAAQKLQIVQSPIWENWTETSELGTPNMADAPIFLRKSPGNYWIFSRNNSEPNTTFVAKDTTLNGFSVPLKTTPISNQFNASGGLEDGLGGYHAWQSHDMVNWVHHGSVSDAEGKWMTTAEQVGDKTYLYYDFPNDQDPHLIIDEDLTDGKMGKKMGIAFKDPSDGSDAAIIRDLEGNFHLILEDWSPLNASKRSWDSPLASHAISKDGINGFKLVEPAVDYRAKPTGKYDEYPHPHWYKEDPENFPGKEATEAIPQHRIKKGDIKAFAKYEIYEPEQPAYGDWAAIAIGGQYYLFGDYDPVGLHGRENMKTAWFTSSDINKPFTFCGAIGKGHPDPDIMFAEGQFYLISQTNDFISPGPWVETVTVRVGVDTDDDGEIDEWSKWQEVKENYDYVEGFSKQVAKIPAALDLADLPDGYGFQIELILDDTTDNESKPMIEAVELVFK
ncbi:hypothetical protein Q4Q35_02960 [Flavivirga aquimarina]|uniref:Glycosyl hydrolase family 43 n=1 Tax=Flavivirga aquimarina TaxID=2027862 RepID=A0ABT8W6L1_9FLAO|nr:hypothetical protein [Flavivirga aquimarina]MDO5968755.1 hypothetical protein [Flavivirga aquimarina]